MLKVRAILMFLLLFLSVSSIDAKNIVDKSYKWKISSCEEASDIRQLNIPLDYTGFYKVDLANHQEESRL